MKRLRALGIRSTTVLSATMALGLGLLVGALLLRSQLHDSLYSSIRDQTVTRANDVAALVATGDFSPVLDASGPTPGWIQVVDDAGKVVASTANVARLRQGFAPIDTAHTATARSLSGLAIDTGEPVSVATVAVRSGGRWLTVIAASPLDLAEASDRKIIISMLVVFPVLLVFSAATVWLVVRRALRPVEAIRAEVAVITTSDLSRRVPQPQSNDEIGRLASTMNQMLDGLQASVLRQQRFVGDASHELRSPLASLRSQLEVSLLENQDERWEQTVNEMLKDHDRLERLIVDLLALARHDDHVEHRQEPVDLGYLVRSEMSRRPPVAGLTVTVGADNALIAGDADSFARILRNLVDNAERHASTRVDVTVRRRDGVGPGVVEMVVADDGPGIEEAMRAAVFERFRRLDEARATDHGGSGLGLAIVADLVDAHGGTVTVEPSDRGARFVVRVPALR